MGGLAGNWIVHRTPCIEELHRTGRRLAESIAHRGQQAQQQALHGAGLSLAVMQSEPDGRQLCASPDGRYVVVATGHLSDRSSSSRQQWQSDFLSTLSMIGVEAALSTHRGSACFAIWDAEARSLTIARDRMGEGDVYYACTDFGLVFSSDLQTIIAECPMAWAVDQGAVAQLLQFGYIPAPKTIYQGVFKLVRGTMRTFHAEEIRNGFLGAMDTEQIAYWDHRMEIDAAIRARSHAPMTEAQALNGVEQALSEAVDSCNGRATVCLLSGGVDSSLVASALQRQTNAPIDTLTIGFEGSNHDESAAALEVAKAIGAKNECVTVRSSDLLNLVTCLPRTYSEPFADSAAVPTMAAARFTGRRWTNVLTGDGGDELFFGHSAYPKALRNYEMARRLPLVARRFANRLYQANPERARLGGLSAVLAEARCSTLSDTYLSRVSRWRSPATVVADAPEVDSIFTQPWALPAMAAPGEVLLFLDQAMELPEGLLTRSDRAFGSRGVEVRNPFLSARMVELSWRIPMPYKYAGSVTKCVLKNALERHLPRPLVYRPKQGLGSPVSDWLRGPLREWAESLLRPDKIERGGVLNAERIRKTWHSFLNGERKFHTHLWPVLMFLAWDEQQRNTGGRR